MNLVQPYDTTLPALLRKVVAKAQAAASAGDTDEARKMLNEVWFAVHDAQQALNDAEKATRAAALAQAEHRSAA